MNIRNRLKKIYHFVLKSFFKKIYRTRTTLSPITFKIIFFQKVLGFNRDAYWPVDFRSRVSGVKNIYVGIGSSPGLAPGCYIQGIGEIYIGDHVLIAPNVGIISANHNLYSLKDHHVGKVKIGSYSWIGMNSIILPNVDLGEYTIVAAGSVVTKSFSSGYCIIGGNPAKIIKKIDKSSCEHFKSEFNYHGYLDENEFELMNLKNKRERIK